ncbi:PREDICTED: vegetative cell wall protein gp1-like [Chrysochloris asiatica]|uniref:Vegetative cell wall protein gp1-like n=1 Tax=Chrysochloris asiatica TaxID=185453 RepID=A0A9B0TPI5_CHRAS|nr:PREDICTED: vegetative cell wall protein gp1-like [Chrysochloris asiatica]
MAPPRDDVTVPPPAPLGGSRGTQIPKGLAAERVASSLSGSPRGPPPQCSKGRTAEGWGNTRVPEGRPPPQGTDGSEKALARLSGGSPVEGRRRAQQPPRTPQPPDLQPPVPDSSPLRRRPFSPYPHPNTAPPASIGRSRISVARRQDQHPRPAHTRPPLRSPRPHPDWCSRQRWAPSNAALGAIAAQPPPTARTQPSAPSPGAEPSLPSQRVHRAGTTPSPVRRALPAPVQPRGARLRAQPPSIARRALPNPA